MSIKNDFLLAWYDILWRNIDRSMTGMWQVLAPITVVGTGLWALSEAYLPIWLGGSAILLVIFWALNLAIDLNSWHRRNMYLLTGVERYFLDESDYGSIIPKAFREPKREWVRFYSVHGWTFILLLILAIGYLFTLLIAGAAQCWQWLIICAVLALGGVYTGKHFYSDTVNQRDMYNELFAEKD